jgi:hypothetical protein
MVCSHRWNVSPFGVWVDTPNSKFIILDEQHIPKPGGSPTLVIIIVVEKIIKVLKDYFTEFESDIVSKDYDK